MQVVGEMYKFCMLKPMNNNKPLPNFALCLMLDVIGCVSFTIPFLGEFSDVIWAPVSGWIFYKLFQGRYGLFGGAFSFLEELLPFSDILPTFTLAWMIRYFKQSRRVSIPQN